MIAKLQKNLMVAFLLGTLCAGAAAVQAAPIVLNPSFEANSNGGNGYGSINDWTASDTGLTGTNTISQVFDGGVPIPDGDQAAFLQSPSSNLTTISQLITGFEVGKTYELTFFYNGRETLEVAQLASLQAFIDGNSVFFADNVVKNGSYLSAVSDPFVATSTSLPLLFQAVTSTGVDGTVLVDLVQFNELAPSGVPEPSTYALGLVGLAGLGLVAWRRRAG